MSVAAVLEEKAGSKQPPAAVEADGSGSARRPRKVQRRYGVLLDGGALTMVCLEGDTVIAAGHLTRPTPVEALSAWLAERKPRGQVTVSLVAPSEETAEVPLSAGLPSEAMREVIRERVAAHFPKDAGPFAVAARLREQDGGVLARVAAVPQKLVEGLWRVAKPNVRFTLPAMTFTTDGLHLAICETSADLYLVEQGQIREAVALGCGGRQPADGGTEPDLSEYADRVAEEVVQARNSWLRRRLQVAYDKILVSGSGVPESELGEAFRHRGVQVAVDPVAERLPDTGSLKQQDGGLLRWGLALAAAVVDAGPVGYLDDVTRRARRQKTLPGEEVVVDGRLRKALPAVAAVGVLAIALAAIIPPLAGKRALDAAQSAHATALSQQAHYSYDIQLFQYNQRLQTAINSHHGLPWGTLVPAVLATVPQGITVNSLSLNGGAGSVRVTAQATAADPSLIPDWLAVLQGQHLNPTVSSVSTSGSGSSAATPSGTTATTTPRPSTQPVSAAGGATGPAAFTATFTVPGNYR
jgi:hypothetical protein